MIEYLKVGQIINTHGIKGELKIYPLTDNIDRFDRLDYIFIKEKDMYNKVKVESVKYIKNFPIVKLENINDMNEALKYKNRYLYINRENAVPLEENTYFIADLIGMDVVTTEGQILGKIVSVFSVSSNDVYEISNSEGKKILIPAIRDVVCDVDIKEKRMTIKLLEGLIWDLIS